MSLISVVCYHKVLKKFVVEKVLFEGGGAPKKIIRKNKVKKNNSNSEK